MLNYKDFKYKCQELKILIEQNCCVAAFVSHRATILFVLKASIQTAATKVTNIGGRLSSGASFCLRQIPIYISIFFLCSLRFASSLSSTYNTAVTGIANIIPIAPKRLPPINAALNVQSGASPTEPPTTLG